MLSLYLPLSPMLAANRFGVEWTGKNRSAGNLIRLRRIAKRVE